MPKDKLTEYSATNASNTDVGGVNIDEGMLPSAVNNSIRELMTHLKNFSDGTDAIDALAVDNLKLDGNTISSTDTNGNVTIDPNGSGEFLVANNHNVGIGDTTTGDVTSDGTAARTYVGIIGTGNRGVLNLGTTGVNGADVGTLAFTNGSNSVASISCDSSSGSQTNGKMNFATSGSVRMTIKDNGHVAIGNTANAEISGDNLVVGTGSGDNGMTIYSGTSDAGNIYFSDGTSGDDMSRGLVRYFHGDNTMRFWTNASRRMLIDGNGKIGIGTGTSVSPKFHVLGEGTGTDNGTTAEFGTDNTGIGGGAAIVGICCGRGATNQYRFLQMNSDTTSGDAGADDAEFIFYGSGDANADGNFSGGGADYAEYFEWDDGNSSDEDRRGYSVVLANNKVRKATSSDAASDIIGVVSGRPAVVGDGDTNRWKGKYLSDDYGSYLMEAYTVTSWTEIDDEGVETQHQYQTDQIPADVTVPSDAVVTSTESDGSLLMRRRLNPDYDATQAYTPREERQEWDTIGLMGKLRLRAGQPTGDRWIKMRDVATDDDGNVTVEEWLVR